MRQVLAGPPSARPRRRSVDAWIRASDIREFLASRRARITPEQAGLPVYGGNRRVKGLRREEVALLAGISAEYYIRLERGNVRGVSEDVLDGIARALQLDEADRTHLFDLVRAVNTSPARRTSRRPPQEHVRPVIQRILDSLVGVPAFVENERLDVLAANALGEAFYAHQYADPTRPVNGARFVFLNPQGEGVPRSTGTRSPPTSSASSAPQPDATPTTSGSPTSSASSRPAATTSASAGPRTTSTCTAPARSASTTPSSASSPSTSNGSSSPATPASG